MSPEGTSAPSTDIQGYFQVWAESVRGVLAQVAGTPFEMEALPAEAAAEQAQKLSDTGYWARFSVARGLSGEHAFLLARPEAVSLAQLLMAETPDAAAEFTPDRQDAAAELIRQFAGSAAVALKAQRGNEVELKFKDSERPGWTIGQVAGFRFTRPGWPPLGMFLEISAELVQSLSQQISPSAPAPAPAVQRTSPRQEPERESRNIDLLMDVELEATLRFGERQLFLRDVLEFNSGSVIELDRNVQEPVELLVGGRVVARGEVVVVNGNYGLRVIEILTPMERIQSLGK